MSSATGIMPKRPGISRMIFVISLVIVAVAGGLTGYFSYGLLHPGAPNETLNGAGATFPYPFLSAVATNYSRIHTNVQINYQAIGSGGGIKALTAKTVDFAASDAPLNKNQVGNLTAAALHIPETIGAVVLGYNVLETDGKTKVSTGLNLTAPIIAAIFLSTTSNPVYWDDNSIKTLNPSIQNVLPHQPIISVHRSDGSGTTFVFTGYLNTASSSTWTLGQGTAVAWPGGLGASGNQGVAGVVLGTTYTMGYIELAYALTNPISYGYIQNADGNNYVKPSITTVGFAVSNASSTINLPQGNQSWSSVSLLNAKGQNSYPIVSFTYMLEYKELSVIPGMTLDKAKALVDFLWFIVHDGQALGPSLGYAPLPAAILTIDETSLRSITFNGQSLHT